MRSGTALAGLGALVAGSIVAVRVRASRFERATARRVDELLEDADDRPKRVFTRDDLSGLPDPVRRYLDAVLEEGRPYVRTVRIRQRGEFRLGDATAPWRPFVATQNFTTDPPGFVWDARIELAPFVPVRVVDAYADDEGSLRAALLSAIPVADAEPSPELNAGELLRYLAETVWFPTALLPGEGVEWEPIDGRSARATIERRGTTASLVFRFDERNRVRRVHSEGRYREEDDGFAPWTGYFRDYRRRNGMLVPLDAEVEWNLPEGDLRYWRGTLERVDHRPAE